MFKIEILPKKIQKIKELDVPKMSIYKKRQNHKQSKTNTTSFSLCSKLKFYQKNTKDKRSRCTKKMSIYIKKDKIRTTINYFKNFIIYWWCIRWDWTDWFFWWITRLCTIKRRAIRWTKKTTTRFSIRLGRCWRWNDG